METLLNAAPINTTSGFYRTSHGAEVDPVLDTPGQGVWAIEAKRGAAGKPRRGFYSVCEDLLPACKSIVPSQANYYPTGDGVEATGLRELARPLTELRRRACSATSCLALVYSTHASHRYFWAKLSDRISPLPLDTCASSYKLNSN